MAAPSPILVLTNQLATGGAERLVVETTAAFAEQGLEITVAAAPGELEMALHRGVRFVPLALSEGRAVDPRSVWAVSQLVRQVDPAVIVTNSVATTLAARAAAPARPVVAIAHGWPPTRYPLVAPLLRAATRVVAVSEDVGRRLLTYGLPPETLRVIPNGIDLSRFGPRDPEALAASRRALGAEAEDVLVVHVGRLVHQKRQERIVDSAARLARTHPRLRWALIGAGPRESALAELIRTHHLEDRVRLLGHREDVPDLLLASDLYVSTSDWEGMSLAVLEAMAAGLAIVATDVEGMAALLGDDAGERVPIGDAGALDAAIGRLADDEPERLRRGSVARAHVQRTFGQQGLMRQLAGVLNEAAGRS